MKTPTRKRCACCSARKSPTSFFSNGRGGLRAECKVCTKAQSDKRVLARVGVEHIDHHIDDVAQENRE